MKIEFTITAKLSASTEQVYDAWLDGPLHSEMTGGPATGSKQVGAAYSAWDNYISGKNVELIPNQKIVQTWRTTEFDPSDEDSRLEIDLKPSAKGGCELTLKHSNIPEGHIEYKQGWVEHYFQPTQEYFKKY